MDPELLLLFLTILFMAMAFADLQNPDFELPPSNLPKNSTATTFLLSNANNTIPGWSFEGNVLYVTSGPKLTLPGNGHALQLGQDGKINQTFIASDGFMNYFLTFTLAPGGLNCSLNADVAVSAPDSHGVYSLKQSYGKETWKSYAFYLGSFGNDELVNLVIQSQVVESDSNSTCWPVIDTLLLKNVDASIQGDGNLLLNGGFEIGPEFLSNSTEGILIDSQSSPIQSALLHWSVIGTVKYIDSKHYFVPQGNAAVEIISGISSGIQTATTALTKGDSYNLEFSLGHANDLCLGDFIVSAQAGSTLKNFTVQNNGTGLANKFSLNFKADLDSTPISFLSYTTSETMEGVFCGPVVDDIALRASRGAKLHSSGFQLFVQMIFVLIILYFYS